jgi:serine/threonine-protein kinase HipA
MTSKEAPRQAYVWIWLPGETSPVVAGLLTAEGDHFVFNYGRSYLARSDGIPLYEPELPLRPGLHEPLPGLTLASCLRDAAPDAWGRRVIINRRFGRAAKNVDPGALDELTYLLESGSDRIGALDFQASATAFRPREGGGASLDELIAAAERVEKGIPLTPGLDQALFHGSSLGGARPKAMIVDDDRKYIAKFSAQTDILNVVKAEFLAMRLAARVGLTVAPVRLARAAGRDVLLIERFDRARTPDGGWTRRAMVSALTLFGLDELMARYASYEELCTIIRHRFRDPRSTLRELFQRLVFNILVGNTDDHARNHAAFWDGEALELTPAYDICPQARVGHEASQAMLIVGDNRLSQLSVCRQAAANFQLSRREADAIVEAQTTAIEEAWPEVCDEAELSLIERTAFWGRQFLNPFAFQGTA